MVAGLHYGRITGSDIIVSVILEENMQDLEQELQAMGNDEPEVALPSMEEQQKIVAELKKLEAEGKLTPEIMEEHFGKFFVEKKPH